MKHSHSVLSDDKRLWSCTWKELEAATSRREVCCRAREADYARFIPSISSLLHKYKINEAASYQNKRLQWRRNAAILHLDSGEYWFVLPRKGLKRRSIWTPLRKHLITNLNRTQVELETLIAWHLFAIIRHRVERVLPCNISSRESLQQRPVVTSFRNSLIRCQTAWPLMATWHLHPLQQIYSDSLHLRQWLTT